MNFADSKKNRNAAMQVTTRFATIGRFHTAFPKRLPAPTMPSAA
jgi:hypothetical protein